ncbi:MAG: hypothetical protein IKC48_00795 [Clostridia bacterium]|nr:hypothetical protein [Clostridia bacterium]
MDKKKKIILYVVLYSIAAFVAFVTYYLALPPINVYSVGFWFFLAFVSILGLAPYFLMRPEIRRFGASVRERFLRGYVPNYGKKKKKVNNDGTVEIKIEPRSRIKRPYLFLIIPLVPLVVLMFGGISSATIFNASAYSSVISVTEAEFATDMPQTDKITHIALMDTDTAKIIGNRTLGSLSHVVSQYEVSEDYSQINFMGTPKKVSNLEYAGFFKWIGNRANGVPGYVMVDPIDNTAKYVELSEPIKYVKSGFFGDDLKRRLRFDYPTKILGEPSFELDDEGRAVFIVPCYKPRVSLFGAKDVSEVIIFQPCTGESDIYSLDQTPAWIDEVYNGELACKKYDWKGKLSGGFINSIIGQKDCKVTTDDFGYVILGDDVWYYTGVTSVNSDESNIGFIMTNARTGEYKFYPVIGAEEHSAMAAAEGEVQEKGYIASFPALINASGQPTYIMTLKDEGGLVKLYALVNVQKYSIVATGTTQEKTMEAYEKLLFEEGIIDSLPDVLPGTPSIVITTVVEDVRIITTGGESYVYISAPDESGSNRCLFRAAVGKDESVLFIRVGDTVTLEVAQSQTSGIFDIINWHFE